MSHQIIQLSAEDFEEGMDFLNLVFGQHAPHDFARMLPSIYRPFDPSAREDGFIGFRVASIPEPTASGLLLITAALATARRRT